MTNAFSALLVAAKQPYLDWARQHSGGAEAAAIDSLSTPTVWIVPDFDLFATADERARLLCDMKEIVFPKLLADWDNDHEVWPKELTAALFDEWFDCQVIPLARFALHGEEADVDEDDFDEDDWDDFDDEDLDEEDLDEEILNEDDEGLDDDLDDLDDEQCRQINKRAHAAIVEAVDKQLSTNEPPEVKQTFKRLRTQGIDSMEAKRLIGLALVGELWDVVHDEQEYDHARYVSRLQQLPSTPWIEEED